MRKLILKISGNLDLSLWKYSRRGVRRAQRTGAHQEERRSASEGASSYTGHAGEKQKGRGAPDGDLWGAGAASTCTPAPVADDGAGTPAPAVGAGIPAGKNL